MTKEFKLQDPGEGIHEAEILDVYVKDGDEVEEGQDLFAVETDKAAVDIPSPFTGTVDQIKVEAGDMARVGDVLLTYQPRQGDESRAEGSEDREEKEGGQEDETAKGDKGDH